MDANLVSYAFWQQLYQWAMTARGYSFDRVGSGKAPDHPVNTISWYDAIKWCNARSELEGLTPCYYTDVGLATVYKSGQAMPYVKWEANGYRLPTEAEWEKAARAGLTGKRFPWGDLITHGDANYYSMTAFAYDTSTTRGFHPDFDYGDYPYTSPVGHFAPNGYGLYDMAGNMFSWCWDWYDPAYYGVSPATDPRGPSSGTGRVCRGGFWAGEARTARCAMRASAPPANAGDDVGFRCVRGH
jgi:formylglycine-generating enzyme required for sulfatase activity